MKYSAVIDFFSNWWNAKSMLKSLDIRTIPNVQGKIVFNTVRSTPLILHQELLMAYSLAVAGCEVHVLLDDGVLHHWDYIQVHDVGKSLSPYRASLLHRLATNFKKDLLLKAYAHPRIAIHYYSNLVGDSWKKTSVNENDFADAISSTRRYFESGRFDTSNPHHAAYFESCLRNCMISKTAAIRFLESFSPVLSITSHGIYSLWGPFYRTMKNAGVRSIVYGAHAYLPQQIIISDSIHQVLTRDSSWLDFKKNHNLSEDEKEIVKRYFHQRINHSTLDTKAYYGGISQFNEFEIQRSGDELVFGLFPNLIWDGDVVDRDTIFSGVLDWLCKTIDHFECEPKHKLVIRFHPAETTLWSNSLKLQDVLLNQRPNFEKLHNISIIKSNDNINTYDFIKNNIDVGLVYDGILSLEMTYMGIPVINCANSRYSGEGIFFEPRSIEEYTSWLANPDVIISHFLSNQDNIKESLLRYSYWFFYRAGYFMPVFDPSRLLSIKCHVNSAESAKDFRRTIEKLLSYIT